MPTLPESRYDATSSTSIVSATGVSVTIATSTSTRRGFTLTELLVSLSIIAVLGALAVPALRSAMDRADQTVCLSNLRQLGQGISEYVLDYGHYPAAEWSVRDAAGQVVERKRWYHLIAPYIDSGPRATSSGQGRAQIDATTGLATQIVLPSEDDADPTVLSSVLSCPEVSHWIPGRNGGYGYNHQYLGDARIVAEGAATDDNPEAPATTRYRHYPVRTSSLEDPSRTLVLIDSAGTGDDAYRPPQQSRVAALGNHSFTVDPPRIPPRGGDGVPTTIWASDGSPAGIGTPTQRSLPHGRHRGGVCALFGDGRVEWLPLETVTRDDALWNGTGQGTP